MKFIIEDEISSIKALENRHFKHIVYLETGIFGSEHSYTGDHNTSDSYKSYYIMARISSSFHQLRCTGKPVEKKVGQNGGRFPFNRLKVPLPWQHNPLVNTRNQKTLHSSSSSSSSSSTEAGRPATA
ncbi:hypothetical protein T06_14252 [Trichinella sp. T6]|nr:hypothetical protein T06_14252 [Trichinella sp. T6]